MIKIGDGMKNLKAFGIVVVFFLWLYFVGLFAFHVETDEYIQKEIGADISSCKIMEDEDTHGGFLGDGDYLVIADCSENKEKILNQISHWKNFSLTKNLEQVVYGFEKDGVEFSKQVPETIPKIENGYYYFYDRHSESQNAFSDEGLFDRASYNYTLAFYDMDTDLFYYFELDT